MEKLLAKIQYVNFEPGEFTDEKLRTKDDVIALIESFPWEKQREHIQIGITNPGVVIQTDTNYLKLALYYNGKFVLYFFDGANLYSKSFMGYKEAYPFMAEYFDKGNIDFSIFKKENLLFKHVAVHFITNDFRYEVTEKRKKAFLIHSSLFNFITFLVFFVMGIISICRNIFIGFIICLIPMLLMGGVINLLLYFNYFRYMKDKMLIISKGCESFWYGDVNNLEQYRKKDIENITIISSYQKGSKGNFWAEFAICKIHFSNNTYPIAFTSLLINKDDLKNKLSKDIQIEEYKTFPFFTDLDVE